MQILILNEINPIQLSNKYLNIPQTTFPNSYQILNFITLLLQITLYSDGNPIKPTQPNLPPHDPAP